MKLRTVIAAAAAGTALFLAALTVCAAVEVSRHEADLDWVEHTHAVLDQLEQARLQLKTAELESRAYRAGGGEAPREGVRQAAESVRWASEALEKLTADNPSQAARAQDLATASAEIRASVENRARGERDGAAAAARAEDVARSMEIAERVLLSQRSRREQKSADFALGVLASALLFAAVLAGGALLFILRGVDERERLQTTLEQAVTLARALPPPPR
ncbi:MAG TPA: CHASE3 domain-containing protein [Elusimicrobiota bacterium]|nr:CHASE3 domain-containing protein [Elusimicrobiota bacterium]